MFEQLTVSLDLHSLLQHGSESANLTVVFAQV